jgi:hypothetical protein
VRGGRRLLERLTRRLAVEQVPLEVRHLSARHEGLVDVVRAELGRGTEERVHRALAVRRHDDQRATGRRTRGRRRHRELDADRGDVVSVHGAELIVTDAPDEAATSAERGQPGERVRRRAARRLDPRAHRVVQRDGLVWLDQAHRPPDKAMCLDEVVGFDGDDVDECVADAHNVQACAPSAGRGGCCGHESGTLR